MSNPLPIETLEVIAYADKLTEYTVPTIVTPIFRDVETQQRIVFPPFTIYQGEVRGATIGDMDELGQFARRDEIVLIDDPFPARAQHELWIDENMAPHYELIDDARDTLREIATMKIKEAIHALKCNNLDEADRYAGAAISADDQIVDPFAIKAAIRRLKDDDLGFKVMTRLAESLPTFDRFEILVEYYASKRPVPELRSASNPMYKVASMHPSIMLQKSAWQPSAQPF